MEQENALRLRALELVQVADDTFALSYNNKLYYIGAVLFRLLQYVQDDQSFDEIQARIAAEYKLTITPQKFSQILTDTLRKLEPTTADAEAPRKQSYVYGQVKLINERWLPAFTTRLAWLCQRPVVVAGLVLALAATGLLILRLGQDHLLHPQSTHRHGAAMLVAGYLSFTFLGLFHELGHATAATRYKISPKEIGFGFYLVLPVLYTDVSRVWLLPKTKRLAVNTAGIYFQLLLVPFFYLAYELFRHLGWPGQHLIISVFLTNLTLAVYSLNPFFRNDGYWVFSDLFALPNLSSAAQNYPHKCWQYLRSRGQAPFRTAGLTRHGEWALLLYSVGRLGLISWLSYLASTTFSHSIEEMGRRLAHQGQYAHETPFERTVYLLRMALFFTLFTIMLYRRLWPSVRRWLKRLAAAPAATATTPVASLPA